MSESIGGVIKALRESRKLSKARLARESGISDAYLVQIEKGDRTPSAAVLRHIARALRIAPHRLLIPGGHYDADLLAKAESHTRIKIEFIESERGEPLDEDGRDRLLHASLDELERSAAQTEAFENADPEELQRFMDRMTDPDSMSSDEYWNLEWEADTPWAPEGWADLSDRDRSIVQQLITRLAQLQPKG